MHRIIQFVLQNRLLMGALGFLVLGMGYFSYINLPVDAFPDVTPVLVQVFTETQGLAPEEVEKYVTYPTEVAMNGLPNLKEVRSISNFGLSVVNIYFKDGTNIYFARQLVNERLQHARENIPQGFGRPEMGPIATGMGQIIFYFLEDESGKRTPEEMREIQDWMIKFNLQTVPGVTEVLSLGGEVKQFQIRIRPSELLRFDLSLHDILRAVRENNSNVGAQFIVKNSAEFIVRSIGLAEGIPDLESIVLKTEKGTPVFLSQVADVAIGGEIRRGLATLNGKGEAVVGMVLKLIGTNTSEVVGSVKTKMQEINKILPPGVKVVPYYDQATLVKKCLQTVTRALIEAIILVILIQLVMLGGIRPSVVVLAAIPFSLALSFLFMKYFDISANLMSLGGLAIALGLLVDGSVVMVENIDRHLRETNADQPLPQVVGRACEEVARPIVFSLMIIIVVFLPLFTLQGVEGKTFRPLAQTLSFAMLGSLIFAIFLVPVIAGFLMQRPKENASRHEEVFALRWLLKFYRPALSYFVHNPQGAIILAIALLLLGGTLFTRLGSEFVPRLQEGDLLIRATMAPSISLEEARETILRFERRLLGQFPEVARVVTRIGRGDLGAHADPVNNAEAFVALFPKETWKSKRTSENLIAEMSKSFENFPGVQFNFTQPIAAAVDELITGVRGDLAVKIFGPDMDILRRKAEDLEAIMKTVPGSSDVLKDQIAGTPQLRIKIDRRALSRYGINVQDVQEIIRTAVGGTAAGQVFEGIKRFDIFVRYTPENRTTPEAIGRILVPSSTGIKVPLSDLARIEEMVGPRQITRERNQRFITVQCNVRQRDIGSFVKEAQKNVDSQLRLSPGYLVTWGGQFQLQQEANRRMMLVIPVTLLIVFLLLFFSFNSLKNCILILLNIPLALVGGVFGLWVTEQNLSVPASVGFIALFGIALANGMVLVTCLNQLLQNGIPLPEASIRGACLRLRPVLMTASAAALGLLPMVFSSGTGSEVQRPLATVVVGGLVTSTFLTLLVIPALYRWFAIDPDEQGEV